MFHAVRNYNQLNMNANSKREPQISGFANVSCLLHN